ncbi:PUA domain-containing protein [Methanosarcina sp. Z-7115]|uniref:PUA domain-containing protein n=1 Tax=Methanosarcina baikalica TaxID=3073890 RepID=A0ABU2D2P5_9EURY|nr:PUA domain-containing protein [Methanosarcina sp. Z-7115]MDR7666117.1 PUA domain-containing protein [Methanosarcina sp. Z-7115]
MNCDRKRLTRVRMIADYQFGKGIGKELFPEGATFQLSRTKRVRQVFHSGKRIATARAKDGFFTLSIEGASIIHRLLPGRKLRVVISAEAAPFVEKGKTAFIKHVVEIDPELRAGEEVLVTDEADRLLATGQLLLSPAEILALDSGAAVDVRVGIASKKEE